jgi:predicted ArsR family transcriptional regulator
MDGIPLWATVPLAKYSPERATHRRLRGGRTPGAPIDSPSVLEREILRVMMSGPEPIYLPQIAGELDWNAQRRRDMYAQIKNLIKKGYVEFVAYAWAPVGKPRPSYKLTVKGREWLTTL